MSKFIRDRFEKNFGASDFDNLMCPYGCQKTLNIKFDMDYECLASQEYNNDNIDDDYYSEFVRILECTSCCRVICLTGVKVSSLVMCGVTGVEDEIVEFTIRSHDCSFLPIEISDKWPNAVAGEIKSSGNHLFSDREACMNNLRKAIECLVDEFKIPSTGTIKGKDVFISLHNRIDSLCTQEKLSAPTKQLLTSVKWLGNKGSHSSSRIEKDDVLHAYDALKNVLDEIYVTPTILANAQKINTSKGN